MNKQLIQKLVDESGLKDILADHAKKYPGIYQAPIEEFAELIVRECTDVCEEYRGTKWGKAAECIGDSIREHFGVEE